MRIGMECTVLTRSRAGIGFYTYQLLRALSELEGDEEYWMLYNRPLPEMDLPARLRQVCVGPKSTHLWAQTRLTGLCTKHGVDLLHSPGQAIPLFYPGKSVLTIHDLAHMIHPEHKELASRFVWTCLVPLMARRATHIITVSDNTRRDVIERLGIEPSRVTRVYEAAGPEYYPVEDDEAIRAFRRAKALEPGYIVAVGTLEPRKNYPFLFRAFAHWLQKYKPDATLVVIGKKGWLYDEIFSTFESLGLRRHVRFEGYVGDLDLMRLYYSGARFSILTPHYEGFWLPGLESLACGTPVIAPNHSSIPEVVGDAGYLVDSLDEEEWAQAMQRMWTASDREAWRRRGVERSKRFSWKQAAIETLDVYRRVLNNSD